MEFVSLIGNWIFWGSFRHIVLQFLVRSITEGFAMAIKDVFAVNSIFLSISPMNLKQIIDREKNQRIEVVRQQCVQRESFLYIPYPKVRYWIQNWHESIDDDCRGKCNLAAMAAKRPFWKWCPNDQWFHGNMCRSSQQKMELWKQNSKYIFLEMYSPELLTPMNCE